MAGSYNHMVNRNGRLLGNERFTGMVENLGDAYEAAEECFGMIWWLAERLAPYQAGNDEERVTRAQVMAVIEEARQHYQDGLRLGGVSGQ